MLKLFKKKENVRKEVAPIYVTLYATSGSKLSTRFNYGFWRWSTRPSLYAMHYNLPILRTKVRIDISTLNYSHSRGDYNVVVNSKTLQRKLISMSAPYHYRGKK